jgi:hypothetical protein
MRNLLRLRYRAVAWRSLSRSAVALGAVYLGLRSPQLSVVLLAVVAAFAGFDTP